MSLESSPIGEDQPIKRGPGRPRKVQTVDEEIRPQISDSRRAAEEYAQALMDQFGDVIENYDEFFVDPAVVPDGWRYEWKVVAVGGKEEPHYMTGLLSRGWRAVPTGRHPELMPPGTPHEAPIEKKGQRLMELPEVLVIRRQKIARREAIEQITTADRRLSETPPNTAPREEFPESKRKLRREWVTPKRPDDEE